MGILINQCLIFRAVFKEDACHFVRVYQMPRWKDCKVAGQGSIGGDEEPGDAVSGKHGLPSGFE